MADCFRASFWKMNTCMRTQLTMCSVQVRPQSRGGPGNFTSQNFQKHF